MTAPPPITRLLLERLGDEPVAIVDCGARGGGEERKWSALGRNLRLMGFEADEGECERLNGRAQAEGRPHTYYPLCLWRASEESRSLYVTLQPDSTSLYKPAAARIARWKQTFDGKTIVRSGDVVGLDRVVEVRTTTLASWAEAAGVSAVDYVKLDVQGAELDILEGSGPLLDTVLGLEVEVEFTSLYENQPLFADVDRFLRGRGFTFFTFLFTHTGHFVGRNASPLTVVHQGGGFLPHTQTAGQLVTADALYFRDPLDPSWPAGARMRLASYLKLAILAELCGQAEYAFELLFALGTGAAPVHDGVDGAAMAAVFRDATTLYSGASLAARSSR